MERERLNMMLHWWHCNRVGYCVAVVSPSSLLSSSLSLASERKRKRYSDTTCLSSDLLPILITDFQPFFHSMRFSVSLDSDHKASFHVLRNTWSFLLLSSSFFALIMLRGKKMIFHESEVKIRPWWFVLFSVLKWNECTNVQCENDDEQHENTEARSHSQKLRVWGLRFAFRFFVSSSCLFFSFSCKGVHLASWLSLILLVFALPQDSSLDAKTVSSILDARRGESF